MKNGGLELLPGHTLRIHITSQVIAASEEIADYDKEITKCINANPFPHSIFREYTQNSCYVDCAIQNLLGKGKMCRTPDERLFPSENVTDACLPWDVPVSFKSGESKICNGKSAAEFKKSLGYLMEQGSTICPMCLPECESFSFQMSTDQYATDTYSTCKDQDLFQATQVYFTAF